MTPRVILVVEDNPISRKMMRFALQGEGYEVLEAGDGRAALELARERGPELVLLDYVLPDLDGLRLAGSLRALPGASDLPVVMITGMVSQIEELRARAGPSITILPKPVEPSLLVEVAHTHLAKRPRPGRKGRLVLVVDDEPLNRKLTMMRLRGAGFEVETASSGPEALKSAVRSPPDAVLSDVLMPGMDGFVFCATLRQQAGLSHVPVILLSSAYAEDADRRLALEMGASELLVRTPDLREAIEALENGLRAGPPPPAAIDTKEMMQRHKERLQIQLERQVARNENLIRQGAIQAAALSMMRGLAEALSRPRDLPSVLADVLVHCLDSAGLSTGLLYIAEAGGGFRLQAQAGIAAATKSAAVDAFGHPEMLRRVMETGEPLGHTIDTSQVREPALAEIATALSSRSLLAVPFTVLDEPFGILLLASDSQDLSDSVWLGFAGALAVQFGQTVALGRSLSRGAASEARYQILMERANDAILLIDPQRRIVEANRQADELFGLTRAEILGRPYDELVAPEEREETLAGWSRLLAEGTIRVEGRHFLRADGSRVAVDLSSAVVKIGEETIVPSILRDITERQRAEAELREAQRRLHHVVTSSPAVLYSLRPSGQANWISDNIERLLGYMPDEAVAPDWWGSHLHPEDRERAVAEVPRLFAEGSLVQEYRFGLKHGGYRWLRAELRLLRDAAGEPEEAVGSWSDITERKTAELKLAESEEQYRLLFESNPHPMYVFDADTLRFLAVNEASIRQYGYSREEFLGLSLDDIRPPEDVPRLLDSLRSQATTRAGSFGTFRHRTRDGSVLEVEISADRILFQGHDAWLVLAADVTDKARLEGQLRQAQKMEAIGQMAGGVAHDFNNLLGVITGYGDLLHKRLEPEHPGHRHLEQIRAAAGRAAGLTRQLLAFSRKQVLEPRILDLNAVLAGVEKMLSRLIGEDVTIQTRLAADLDAVKADQGQIEQVILNLAVNARDAMPGGGRLTLETANATLDAAYSHSHPYVLAGEYVMLAVSDTGEGMDAETLSHIFEPFFTTKEPGKGTGLGLATVFGIVKQSGGHVNVYSEPGQGTTFKVYLPRVEDGRAETEEAPPPSPLPTGTETILLVEDAETLRVMIRETLEMAGYTVLEAAEPEEAIAKVRAHEGPIDLMLTDVILPQMSGPNLAATLEQVRPRVRVLFMSGYTADAIGSRGVLPPGTQFIAKPFTADAVLRKLRAVLDGPPR